MSTKKKIDWPENAEEDFRYVPPKSWSPPNRYPKGEQGYKDILDCEWKKGSNHHFPSEIDLSTGEPYTFEWDVQLPNGNHWNIALSMGAIDPHGKL